MNTKLSIHVEPVFFEQTNEDDEPIYQRSLEEIEGHAPAINPIMEIVERELEQEEGRRNIWISWYRQANGIYKVVNLNNHGHCMKIQEATESEFEDMKAWFSDDNLFALLEYVKAYGEPPHFILVEDPNRSQIWQHLLKLNAERRTKFMRGEKESPWIQE